MVRALFYAGVRERAGVSEKRIEEFSGTLAGLLKFLDESHGITVIDSCKDKDADPLSDLIIMINGRHIAHVGGLDAPVSEGDVVTIFPLVGGG
jgi:MoaD family protein